MYTTSVLTENNYYVLGACSWKMVENPEQGFLTKLSWLPAKFVGNAASIIKALRLPVKCTSNYLFIYAIKAYSSRVEVSILIHYTNSRDASVTAVTTRGSHARALW